MELGWWLLKMRWQTKRNTEEFFFSNKSFFVRLLSFRLHFSLEFWIFFLDFSFFHFFIIFFYLYGKNLNFINLLIQKNKKFMYVYFIRENLIFPKYNFDFELVSKNGTQCIMPLRIFKMFRIFLCFLIFFFFLRIWYFRLSFRQLSSILIPQHSLGSFKELEKHAIISSFLALQKMEKIVFDFHFPIFYFP